VFLTATTVGEQTNGHKIFRDVPTPYPPESMLRRVGDIRRAWCKGCGKHRDEVGTLSWTGLCTPCAVARVSENVDGLYYMRGEPLQRWRRGMARVVGGVLLDDIEPHE
jgi:hypothetical protein